MDSLLDTVEATVSLGVREMASRVNTGAGSFARAAEDLKRTAQIEMSRERLRQIVEGEGKKAVKLAQGGSLTVSWCARDCLCPEGTSLIYLGCDGFTAPTVTDVEKRKRREKVKEKRRRGRVKRRRLGAIKRGTDQRYKEFKITVFYDQTMEHRLVSVTRGDCREAGRIMARDAGRLGLGAADYRIGNIDGGPWIISQIKSRRLPMTAVGLDFYHLSENVYKAVNVLHGPESEPAKALAGDLLHTVKHEGYEPFREKLLAVRVRLRSRAKKSALDRLLNYVSDRREMINYPQFLAHGWRIGSGPTESQCRMVPKRVKGPGKRWDRDNAEAMMMLEALRQSDLWATMWSLELQGTS